MKRAIRLLFLPVLILTLLIIGAGCAAKDSTVTPPSPSPSSTPAPATHSTGPEEAPSPIGTTSPTGTPSSDAEPSAEPSAEAAASPSPSGVPSAKPSSTPAATVTDFSSPGWTLMENERLGGIHYRMSESALTALLGAPESTSDTMNWGADGLDHTDWNYPSLGLKINMVKQPDDVEASVFMITATAPCALETQRGIKIGDRKADVLKAYADVYNAGESDDYSIVFGTIYGGIIMDLDNGVVTRIFIGAAAE